MASIHLVAVVYICFVYLLYQKQKTWTNCSEKSAAPMIYLCMGIAFFLRLLAAGLSKGFETDTGCFYSWAMNVTENGFGSFYSSGSFADYPPVAVYILYWVGSLLRMVQSSYLSFSCCLILKLPSIICDLSSAYLLWKLGKSKKLSNSLTFMGIFFYLTNPAVFLDSSLWGQVDSIFTFELLLLCILLTKGKTIPAYLVFGLGVLTKPQMCIFAPLLLYGIWEHVLLSNFSLRRFFVNLFSGIGVLLGMVLLCLPFGLSHTIQQYLSTLGSYPYVAVNAFNFWGFFGLNWISQDTPVLFTDYQTLGNMILILLLFLSTMLFFLSKHKENKYFTTGAFLITFMFLFSVRMHERYLYPAFALLLFAYVLHPVKEYLISFVALSVLNFYNTSYVLYFYDIENYDRKAPLFVWVSFFMVVSGIYFFAALIKYQLLGKVSVTASKAGKASKIASRPVSPFQPGEKLFPPGKLDWILLSAIILLYSAFALYDLGERNTPQTPYEISPEQSITFSFEGSTPSQMYYYLGPTENRPVQLLYRMEEEDSVSYFHDSVVLSQVFAWKTLSLPDRVTEVTLTSQGYHISLMEICFVDNQGNYLSPTNQREYPALFDEAYTYPSGEISFRNSTYFDEIYHARTAYEYLHGLYSYENTHPPLGKILISLGISLFGMNPFGYRIIGTLFGILMLPVLYLFAREISKNTWCAAFATFLFAFDFMHFAQTRIATIDVFVTFFILLMYYFMYLYSKMNFYQVPLWKTFLPLGACGISMGLGIACKWTGMYAGVGLGVLFFLTLYQRYQEYAYAKKIPHGNMGGLSNKQILQSFTEKTRKTIGFCCIFFGIVPAVIYTLSYLPFQNGIPGLLQKMWQNQKDMLNYHATLRASHYYESTWDQWPLMTKPILYYNGFVSDEGGKHLRQAISSFGNPLVWWIGIPAFFFLLYLIYRRKDRIATFLCIGYLAQYLPWCMVPRLTFIYHYFPSVPFVVLMILYTLLEIKKKLPSKYFYLILGLYALGAFLLFYMFYPVLAGQTVDTSYVSHTLRWNKNWILILE